MPPPSSGYSGTPLVRKLGYKPGMRVRFLHAPDDYMDLLGPLPEGVQVLQSTRGPIDLGHVFLTRASELRRVVPTFHRHLASDGMLWISWPKKTSGVDTDLTGDVVRSMVLETGLVDIKVCAVNETWSALKFVIRKRDRS